MTAQRPSTTQHPNSHSGDDMLKKKRGPINKRACEKCRAGKVRCDGNAETQTPCSNCIPDQCVYDQSPRKNKQLEHMKLKLDNTERNLMHKKKQSEDQQTTIRVLQLEKKIMGMLIESADRYPGDKETFQALHKAVNESKVFENILFLIEECLGRLDKPTENYNAVIESLKHVASATTNLPSQVSIGVALGKRNDYLCIADDIDVSYRSYLNGQRNIQICISSSDESKKGSADSMDPDVILSLGNMDNLHGTLNAMSISTVVSPTEVMSDQSPSDCRTPSPQPNYPFLSNSPCLSSPSSESSLISPIDIMPSNVENKFYSQSSAYLNHPYQPSGSSTGTAEYPLYGMYNEIEFSQLMEISHS